MGTVANVVRTVVKALFMAFAWVIIVLCVITKDK